MYFSRKKSKWIHGLDICQFHDFGLFVQCLKIIGKILFEKKITQKYFEILMLLFGAKKFKYEKVDKNNIRISNIFGGKFQIFLASKVIEK